MKFLLARGPNSDFITFDVLQLLAFVLVAATYLCALLSSSLARMKTWFALMLSSLLYCGSFLLLLGHQTGPEPPFGLCLFQAGLIYAAPPVVAASGLAFVVELYLRLSTGISRRILDERLITALLFLAPLVHMIIFWIALFTGLSHQSAVSRDEQGMFCHIDHSLPTTSTGVTVIVLISLMILGELYTIHYLWRRRSVFREVRRMGVGPIFPFKIFVRVGIYTLAGGLGIIMVDIFLNTSSAASSGTLTVDLLGVIPLSIAIIFGTQEDIVRWYMFWRGNKPPRMDMDDVRIEIEVESALDERRKSTRSPGTIDNV